MNSYCVISNKEGHFLTENYKFSKEYPDGIKFKTDEAAEEFIDKG